MIHTMQLFNLIKSSIKNLMNLPNLHCSNHPRQFEEKNPQISINQSIGSNYLCNSSSILKFTIDLASRSSLLQEKRDLATHAWRFGLTRHVWLARKWGKIDNSIERENLENFAIRNVRKVHLMRKSSFYL